MLVPVKRLDDYAPVALVWSIYSLSKSAFVELFNEHYNG